MGSTFVTVVGVTGAQGFFGWHLRCRLHARGWPAVLADRSTFADPTALDEFVRQSDVIVHLAGVNRADSAADVYDGNCDLARSLVSSIERTGASPDIVYANSIKASEAGPYGESKAFAADHLGAVATTTASRFVDIRFPHLFGEFGVPFYNSGVTTFAYQLANGLESDVSDGLLELLHIQDAAELIIGAVEKQLDEALAPSGRTISVPDCYTTMRRLAAPYVDRGVVPEIAEDEFELRLFNTIRSQMWPNAYPMPLTKHADSRGAFFEVVRAFGQGQTSISTTVPGVVRGEHYHFDKIERFAVISGQATIRVRRLFNSEVAEFEVTGDAPVVIDMPPLCTHDITNSGATELVTLFWSHDHFDPDNADTFGLPVVGEGLTA